MDSALEFQSKFRITAAFRFLPICSDWNSFAFYTDGSALIISLFGNDFIWKLSWFFPKIVLEVFSLYTHFFLCFKTKDFNERED